MTTPKTSSPEWAGSQAQPHVTVNEALRRIEAGSGLFRVEDDDATAPPGSCADGACYIPAATATGAWAGMEGYIAIAVGTNAANGWYFIAAEEGMRARIKDENVFKEYDGATWSTPSGGAVNLDDLGDVDTGGVVDGDVLTYDSVSGDWVPAAPSGGPGGGNPYERAQTLPEMTNFTWRNQGGSTGTDVANGIYMTAPSSSPNDSWRQLEVTPPSAPYSVITRFQLLNRAANATWGIVLKNTSSGRITLIGAASNGAPAAAATLRTFTSDTGGGAVVATGAAVPDMPLWFRADVDASNITAYWGFDGINWMQIGAAQSIAGFMSAIDRVSFALNVNGFTAAAVCSSFSVA